MSPENDPPTGGLHWGPSSSETTQHSQQKSTRGAKQGLARCLQLSRNCLVLLIGLLALCASQGTSMFTSPSACATSLVNVGAWLSSVAAKRLTCSQQPSDHSRTETQRRRSIKKKDGNVGNLIKKPGAYNPKIVGFI